MLSSIGRAAIRRSGAGARVPTVQVAQSIWHVQRSNASVAESEAGFSLKLYSVRSYATATKTATKPTTKATKSKTAAAKTTKIPVKKVAKKPAKKVAKKPKAKKPVKKPAKKVVKKVAKKPAKKPKKVLTDAQKAKLEAAKKRVEIKELKATALTHPKKLPDSAYGILFVESARTPGRKPTETSSVASEKVRSLSPADLESYNHQVNQNKLANEVAYKKWVESHTPDQIRLANNARKLLRVRTGRRWTLIDDTRLPKKAAGPHLLFFKDRIASGDFKNIKVTEAMKLVSGEWRALSAAEKKVYENRSASEKQRYLDEYKTVYGREAPMVRASST